MPELLVNRDPSLLDKLDETEECGLATLYNNLPTLNIDKQKILLEKSVSKVSSAIRAENILDDHHESILGSDTTLSHVGLEFHPIFSETWGKLKHALVYFHGQPVGTIASSDHSGEKSNYDQLDAAAPVLAKSKKPIVIAKIDADKFRLIGDKYEIPHVYLLCLAGFLYHLMREEARGKRWQVLMTRLSL